MPNLHKNRILHALQEQFGKLHKLSDSQSLFVVGDNAARIYIRYSKIHKGNRTFFGLRQVDLRQLEGYNSFLCFLLDDGSPPLFIPYADFEEIFHDAQVASDGQYKVQLSSRDDAIELYVARQGRFNVEGYVGFEILERSLDANRLKQVQNLSHAQVQTLLAGIGHIKGYEVCIPANDVGRLDWSLTKQFRLRENIPPLFREVSPILSEIDVIWISPRRNTIEGLFEVEHSTTIYSGLLRFNDVFLTDSRASRFSIVSDDSRRALFARQLLRPTFRKSGLAELTSFLEYANVINWHLRLIKGDHDVKG
ncbi:MAG: hypothetical protein HYR81_00585 [Nitrospirae bacterium]|nr:hypothetical protein [Nitrospirota bacterium]